MSKSQKKKEQEARQIALDLKIDFEKIKPVLEDKKFRKVLAKYRI